MKHLQTKISIKKEGNKVTVIASDESLDRHGEVLPIESWDLSKFKGSPRMLVDHDHRVEKIVGKWVNVRVEGKQLLMDAEFHGITELSRAVEEMVNEGFLDTVSVGFIAKDPTESVPKNVNELIETSWVTVPANPNARLVKALEMPVSDDEKAKLEVFAKDAPVVEEPPKPEVKKLPVVCDCEGFKTFITENAEAKEVSCETKFISNLIADSEKLTTLTNQPQKGVDLSKALKNKAITHAILKEMSKTLNHILLEVNKSKKAGK